MPDTTPKPHEEYDERQFKMMLQRIRDFRDGSIGLPQLIDDLDALGSAVQNQTEDWLNDFESAWGVLEDIYSVMLDEGRQNLDREDVRLISDALLRLTSAIQARIKAAGQ